MYQIGIDKKRLEKLIREGKRVDKISEEFICSTTTVLSRIKELGLGGLYKKYKKEKSYHYIIPVRDLFKLSYLELMNKYGCSRGTVKLRRRTFKKISRKKNNVSDR